MHRIFLIGLLILLFAVAVNLIANHFGVVTWYELLNSINRIGLIDSLSQLGILSILFLFLIYPYFLGLTAHLSLRLIKR